MFGRVHRRLRILVFDVDGVAGLRLFVLGGLEGGDVRIQQFFEPLGVDRRIGEDVRVGLEATDDLVDQGLSLRLGLGEFCHGGDSLRLFQKNNFVSRDYGHRRRARQCDGNVSRTFGGIDPMPGSFYRDAGKPCRIFGKPDPAPGKLPFGAPRHATTMAGFPE